MAEMYNNNNMTQAVPQPNPFGNPFSGPGSGLIRSGLGAYGEKIFGSSSEYVQSNVSYKPSLCSLLSVSFVFNS